MNWLTVSFKEENRLHWMMKILSRHSYKPLHPISYSTLAPVKWLKGFPLFSQALQPTTYLQSRLPMAARRRAQSTASSVARRPAWPPATSAGTTASSVSSRVSLSDSLPICLSICPCSRSKTCFLPGSSFCLSVKTPLCSLLVLPQVISFIRVSLHLPLWGPVQGNTRWIWCNSV